MKTVAIIQARMNSTRLPGKVMKQLCGQTVLAHVIARVNACPLVDEIVVATTVSSVDDEIVTEAERCGVRWFRGSEQDVLERYYQAAIAAHAEVIVRVTSDCPLFDPEELMSLLEYFHEMSGTGLSIDYLSNTHPPRCPRGLDAEVFTMTALACAHQQAHQPYEREHVTPYLYQHPTEFSIHHQHWDEDLSPHRWTLDTPEDWQFIQAVYQALYREGEIFSSDEVLALLARQPELVAINAHIQQKQLTETSH